VILPAFGVTVRDFERLRAIGCVLVDTTCGSVLNVWKRVESYARDGFTALIHGKKLSRRDESDIQSGHEISRRQVSGRARHEGSADRLATTSREQGAESRFCSSSRADVAEFRSRPRPGACRCRQSDHDAVGRIARDCRGGAKEHGAALGRCSRRAHFRTFDTICSATQERQDAVLKLIAEPLDLMVVIGGYNSSNTTHLAAICQEKGADVSHRGCGVH